MNYLEVENGELYYDENFISSSESTLLFQKLLNSLPFEQHYIKIFGKTHQIPRLEAFFAEDNHTYTYSGTTLKTIQFTPLLLKLKTQIEAVSNEKFNCVLVNLYRDGQDSNGWHADNEHELGKNPVIASLSFGATRRFDLRHNITKEKISFNLTNGSLIIMKGEMQHYWKHQIAKTKKVSQARINLTFRLIS